MTNWNEIIQRNGTNSIKWDAMETFIGKKDLLPYWVADMDFLSPEPVIKALEQRAQHGVFGYTSDDRGALEAFTNWVQKRHGLAVEPSWIVKTPGIVTAIGLALQAFTAPGDGVVIQPPVYPQFSEMTQVNGRKLLNNPLLLVEGRYEIDFEHLESLFKLEKPKMMIFCNPHNPVGRVWEESVVARLVKLCAAHQVFLFSDEIHSDMTFKNNPFHSALKHDGADSEWLMAAMAPSKTFNIAGLFYSMIIIPDETRRKAFQGVIDRLHLFPVNCFNETAAKAAYSEGEAWLNGLMAYLEDNYACLKTFIAEKMPEVKLCEMQGTYLAWLDFRAYFENGYALKRFMIDQAGVAVNDGRAFGAEGDGFVRFNFGCPRTVMLTGLTQIEEAMRSAGLL